MQMSRPSRINEKSRYLKLRIRWSKRIQCQVRLIESLLHRAQGLEPGKRKTNISVKFKMAEEPMTYLHQKHAKDTIKPCFRSSLKRKMNIKKGMEWICDADKNQASISADLESSQGAFVIFTSTSGPYTVEMLENMPNLGI